MKANVFFKTVCAAVVMLVSSTMVQAGNGYATNDVITNDQVTSRLVYQKEGLTLSNHLKYDFTYDAQDRLSSKETFLWNSQSEQWQSESRIDYSYTNDEIVMEYNRYDKKGNQYAVNSVQVIEDINATALVAQTNN